MTEMERTLTVDSMTVRLIRMLAERIAEEPERPDLDKHLGHHLSVVAREYDQWQRSCTGLRALIGVRLTNLAVDQSIPSEERR